MLLSQVINPLVEAVHDHISRLRDMQSSNAAHNCSKLSLMWNSSLRKSDWLRLRFRGTLPFAVQAYLPEIYPLQNRNMVAFYFYGTIVLSTLRFQIAFFSKL